MNTMDPVDEVEIWAPILADPLDWPPSSDIIPLPSQVEDYFYDVYNNYAMKIDKFVEETQDKTWRHRYLGELTPTENWRRGPRVRRKRKIFSPNSTYLGNMPSGSQGGKWKCRKNNDHWTQGEVIKLVDGVETYGVGRWTKVKSRHFPTSFRDPTHLKDKWRNLLRACGVPSSSKRKAKTQKRMFRSLDSTLIKRIQELATS
ncbi:uncharacterized protein [Lolium perenne]|uniref:uncharacterized protein n=1 Tax=Lolium perenne TaxID=4522 RepID=UPI0021F57402|nr:uncharacterized protein LOC127345236 [Lolium perenne]XP_051227721.1 uncharacterized protein LOC127345236 [Lolium perenne]